jgi:3D (Asp-Asp-Asp) domain-containing protein
MKVISVDPKVIKLNTKVYVPGYGYAIAGDTGGAIKGNKIDIFMSSKKDALNWGRKTVKIQILN